MWIYFLSRCASSKNSPRNVIMHWWFVSSLDETLACCCSLPSCNSNHCWLALVKSPINGLCWNFDIHFNFQNVDDISQMDQYKILHDMIWQHKSLTLSSVEARIFKGNLQKPFSFHRAGFQLLMHFNCWKMIKTVNIFYVSWKPFSM